MSQENPFLIIKIRSLILWFLLSILGILLLSAIGGIFWGIAILFGNPDSQPPNISLNPLQQNILLNVWIYGTILSWCGFHVWRSHLQIKAVIGTFRSTRDRWRLLLLVIPTLLFSMGSGQLLFYGLAIFAPDNLESMLQNSTLFLTAEDTSYAFAYNFFSATVLIIVAPIVEEFLFRGIIFQRFATRWSMGTAIIGSSILFGFLHFNPIGLSVFSVIVTLLYLKTHSLVIPILFHSINNGVVAIVSWATLNTATSQPSLAEVQSVETLGWGVALIVISAPVLVWFIKGNWVKPEDVLPYHHNLRTPALPPRSPEDVQA
ncbi:MAG: CPBP family intramembrane glutamic endopeptidase [Spirulinaceae cyanobacterium]